MGKITNLVDYTDEQLLEMAKKEYKFNSKIGNLLYLVAEFTDKKGKRHKHVGYVPNVIVWQQLLEAEIGKIKLHSIITDQVSVDKILSALKDTRRFQRKENGLEP